MDDFSPEDLSGENEIEHCHSVLFRLACEDAESGEDILSDGHNVSVRDKGRQEAEYSHLKQVITIGFPKESLNFLWSCIRTGMTGQNYL